MNWINGLLSKAFGGIYEMVKKIFVFAKKSFYDSLFFGNLGGFNQLNVPDLTRSSTKSWRPIFSLS